MKKKILIVIACILAIAGVFCGIYYPDSEINNTIDTVQDIVEEEIRKIEETQNQSTIEIPDLTKNDEEILETQETEAEGFEIQGNIAYEGEKANNWNVELGDYVGLTYYSQVDSRWKNKIYTSIGDNSQTIGTSGCGPTSASMIVSSIKGNITPDIMGDLFVEHGYRSSNNGTYWSAFRAVADEFDIPYQETSKIETAISLLKNNNYLIVSVGNGLFTYGGHFIVLVGIEGNTLKIYDPYLYSGKFETSTRRNKVTVSGNTIYCSVDSFKKYSNYKGFFAFGYDDTIVKENTTDNKVTTESNIKNTVGNTYTLSKNTKFYKNESMNTEYNYLKGTKIRIIENVTSKIDKIQIVKTGLIRYAYNSDYITTKMTSQNANKSNFIINKTYLLSQATKMYTSQNMSNGYNYLKGTQIKVLQVSNSIAKVQVIKNKLIRYINIKYIK